MTGLIFLVATALATPAKTFVSRHSTPVVVAHRGASAIAPENTLVAIREAVRLGAPAVEFDVRESSDGVLVVIHDRTLARTTNGKGQVQKRSAADLRRLDAGGWFSRDFAGAGIPSLMEALNASAPDTIAAVEVKTASPVMDKVRDAITATGSLDRVILFSFHPRQIAASQQLMPTVPTLLLIDPDITGIPYSPSVAATARDIGASAVGLNHESVNQAVVDSAHRMELPVFVYTVDARADVQRMLALGVDGIISNQPRATATHIGVARSSLKAGDPE